MERGTAADVTFHAATGGCGIGTLGGPYFHNVCTCLPAQIPPLRINRSEVDVTSWFFPSFSPVSLASASRPCSMITGHAHIVMVQWPSCLEVVVCAGICRSSSTIVSSEWGIRVSNRGLRRGRVSEGANWCDMRHLPDPVHFQRRTGSHAIVRRHLASPR